eukprot:scaffold11845_cov117-Skeletonema_marinoi.AAC.2
MFESIGSQTSVRGSCVVKAEGGEFYFSSTRLTASALKRRSTFNNQESVIAAQADPGRVQLLGYGANLIGVLNHINRTSLSETKSKFLSGTGWSCYYIERARALTFHSKIKVTIAVLLLALQRTTCRRWTFLCSWYSTTLQEAESKRISYNTCVRVFHDDVGYLRDDNGEGGTKDADELLDQFIGIISVTPA